MIDQATVVVLHEGRTATGPGTSEGHIRVLSEMIRQRGLPQDVLRPNRLIFGNSTVFCLLHEACQKWTPKFGPVAKLDFSGSAGHERTAEL